MSLLTVRVLAMSRRNWQLKATLKATKVIVPMDVNLLDLKVISNKLNVNNTTT